MSECCEQMSVGSDATEISPVRPAAASRGSATLDLIQDVREVRAAGIEGLAQRDAIGMVNLLQHVLRRVERQAADEHCTPACWRILCQRTAQLRASAGSAPILRRLSETLSRAEESLLWLLAKERGFRPIGQITALRHGQTRYTNIGLDLTDEGRRSLIEKRPSINMLIGSPNAQTLFFCSPAARAVGTMKVLFPEVTPTILGLIRNIETLQPEAALAWVQQNILLPDLSLAQQIKRADGLFATRRFPADLFSGYAETHERFRRALSLAVRAVQRAALSTRPPLHLLVVSHFEIIHHLVTEIFGDTELDSLNPGEHVELTLGAPCFTSAITAVPLLLRFRDQLGARRFNRKAGTFEPWSELEDAIAS